MTLFSPNQEPKDKSKDEIYLVNPSVTEFNTQYFDDNNKPVHVTLAPLETRVFKYGVGQIVLNHLIDFILNESGFSYKTDVKLEKEEIRKKCIVYE